MTSCSLNHQGKQEAIIPKVHAYVYSGLHSKNVYYNLSDLSFVNQVQYI